MTGMSDIEPDVRLLQAVADPTRLAILRQLSADGPTCACDFSDCCADLSQPTVSHHLKVLRDAGWIKGERRGRWIWYSIRPQAVERAGGDPRHSPGRRCEATTVVGSSSGTPPGSQGRPASMAAVVGDGLVGRSLSTDRP